MKRFALAWVLMGMACATSPLGRSQLTLVPDTQMNAMGSQAFTEMKAKQKHETATPLAQYIQCIARPLAAASKSGIPGEKWEIVLFQDGTANAFALPGGKIGVHSGLLRVAKTHGQLAAVLGHEVGHVIAEHGNERVSQGVVAQGGLLALDQIFFGKEDSGSTKRSVVLGLLGLGTQFGVLLPFGRTQESEADIIGLKLMAKVGFDPSESVQLWKNMIADHGGKAPPEWMSTHPSGETRISQLESHMKEVMPIYEKAVAGGKTPQCVRP